MTLKALATPPSTFAQYLRAHERIEGWFAPEAAATWDALLSFQERSEVVGHAMEIGVWHGKSAALLALHADPARETCVLVDKYMDEERVKGSLRLVRPELESIQLVSGDSRALSVDPMLTEGFESFRWIHIDGEHSGGAVINDLQTAHALLARDGIVCLDDFFAWLYPQVTEAALRYVRENPEHFALFLCGYNKAYLARPHHVHELHAYCRDGLMDDLEARGFELTLAKTTFPAEMNTWGLGPRFQDFRYRGPDWDQQTIRV